MAGQRTAPAATLRLRHALARLRPRSKRALLALLLAVASLLWLATRRSPWQFDTRDAVARCRRAALPASFPPADLLRAPAWATQLTYRPSQGPSVPEHLWQTNRFRRLDRRAAAAVATWRGLNPGLQLHLFDDAAAATFIGAFFGPAVAQVYRTLPLGVMRADFWRYAILYARGGLYADVDTECLQPLPRWLPPPPAPSPPHPVFVANGSHWASAGPLQYHNLTWHDCDLVLGLENAAHLCQWIIAARSPGHPVLQHVLELSLLRAAGGVNCSNPHAVHVHTGPAMFTQGVAEALGLPAHASAEHIAAAVWRNASAYAAARAVRLCVLSTALWGIDGQVARNLYASQGSGFTSQPRWTEELDATRAQLATDNG